MSLTAIRYLFGLGYLELDVVERTGNPKKEAMGKKKKWPVAVFLFDGTE